MIVYHFLAAEFGLRALRDRRLKIARLNELNDPFEFFAADCTDSNTQIKLEEFKNEVNEQYGIVCFSERYDDPVLWSHYADHHRGVALVFEIPDDTAIRISYQPERFTLDVDAAIQRGSFQGFELNQLISTKFSSWNYEKEIRMMCRLSDHFCQIDSKGKKVYFESLRLEPYGVGFMELILWSRTLQPQKSSWILRVESGCSVMLYLVSLVYFFAFIDKFLPFGFIVFKRCQGFFHASARTVNRIRFRNRITTDQNTAEHNDTYRAIFEIHLKFSFINIDHGLMMIPVSRVLDVGSATRTNR